MPPIRGRGNVRGQNANERTPSPPRNREVKCPGAPMRSGLRSPPLIIHAIPFPTNQLG